MARSFIVLAAAFSASLVFTAASVAQQTSTVSYVCNIEGAPAQLTAQVQAIDDAGRVVNSQGWITGVIGTGNYNLYYQGQLVSATARYVFTGENQFADFTDLNTNARFRAQLIVQGQQLLLIANPETSQPARYVCQASQ